MEEEAVVRHSGAAGEMWKDGGRGPALLEPAGCGQAYRMAVRDALGQGQLGLSYYAGARAPGVGSAASTVTSWTAPWYLYVASSYVHKVEQLPMATKVCPNDSWLLLATSLAITCTGFIHSIDTFV